MTALDSTKNSRTRQDNGNEEYSQFKVAMMTGFLKTIDAG